MARHVKGTADFRVRRKAPRDHLMRVEVNKSSASRGENTATP
jgi:hypothetical protein